MSGGYFNYDQYKIIQIVDEIQHLIDNNNSTEVNQWGDKIGRNYSPEVIDKFKEAVCILKKAQIYAQRIDWLVSDDDGEKSFLIRLNEELNNI